MKYPSLTIDPKRSLKYISTETIPHTSSFKTYHSTSHKQIYYGFTCDLKANKTHGFKPCIVISVYQLYIPSIKKATEYHNN